MKREPFERHDLDYFPPGKPWANGPDARAQKAHFNLIPFDKIAFGTMPTYLVKGIIPRLLMHVALGWKYRGRRVQQGPVVYCAFEGQAGLRNRVEAFRQRKLVEGAGGVPFYLIADAMNLGADRPALPGAEILDITGPLEVFAFANLMLQQHGLITEPAYQIEVLAEKPGPVLTSCGLKIIADRAYSEVTDGIDTLFIAGAPDVNSLCDPVLTDWIRTVAPCVRRLASICTGAFLLAESGLLDGRRATSHWGFCRRLAQDYPSVRVEPDKIFIRDGEISTSGGVTSGIDLALALVDEDWGRKIALAVAQYLVVFVKRPGGQSQFSAYIPTEASRRPDLQDLQAWIMGHPTEDLGIEVLADRMAMRSRNFARMFLSETGMTPAKFVEMARIDAARQLLVSSELPIDVVADKSGFHDPEQMRRAFLRQLGVNPHDYRARFSSHHGRDSESRSGSEQGKLAAIMFTDMVGYSALAQRDEGLALELLEEQRAFLRPAFLKHQGQEVKTIGDGFLVEFASAVAAVNCAVELQEALARRNLGALADRLLQVRVGIHLGDVVHRGDDIVGDGVNVAARVEPLADSGGIVVTQQVFDQVYNKIPELLASLGKVKLKNIQRPVEVYRIILGQPVRSSPR